MTFNDRIVAARGYAKLTQQELAGLVGVSQAAVHKLVNGKTKCLSKINLNRHRLFGTVAQWHAIMNLFKLFLDRH